MLGVDKMKSTTEGKNTLLDNSMVLLGNGNGDAARHGDSTGRLQVLSL
jgi:hypothetical protein